jgi:type II secretory pathway component PulC
MKDHLIRMMTHPSAAIVAVIAAFFLWMMVVQILVNNFYVIHAVRTDILKDNSVETVALPKIQDIPRWHLFGVGVSDALPVTQLPFSVVGILQASEAGQSQAMMMFMEGPVKIYHVGDSLSHGVVMTQINVRDVIINNQGHVERVIMKRGSVEGISIKDGENKL